MPRGAWVVLLKVHRMLTISEHAQHEHYAPHTHTVLRQHGYAHIFICLPQDLNLRVNGDAPHARPDSTMSR